MESLPPWRFDGISWVQGAGKPSELRSTTLTLATFNIWFGEHEFDTRNAATLDLLRRTGADIIALQEVTLPFLGRLCAQDWVRRDYCVSDPHGATISEYGTLLLSRLAVRAFEVHELPTMMGRTLLLARLPNLVAGCVHLESLLASAPYREEQLRQIFRILEPDGNAVVMGDFNLCSTWDENRHVDERYSDLWPIAHPGRPGWTVDYDENRMRQALGKSTKRVRFDRIIVRSEPGRLKVRSMELLGSGPISPERPDLYPSDHFGLVATLDVGRASEL